MLNTIYNFFLKRNIRRRPDLKFIYLVNAIDIFPYYSPYYLEAARDSKDSNLEYSVLHYEIAQQLGNKHAAFELKAMLSEKEYVNALDILNTANRYDLYVKIAYVQQLLGMEKFDFDVEKLYCKMIKKRTNGKEPGSMFKDSVEQYKISLKNLIEGIKKDGFQLHSPISLHDNYILNGSHRLAVSIALGIEYVPVYYFREGQTKNWDIQWFEDKGFSKKEINNVLALKIKIDSQFN